MKFQIDGPGEVGCVGDDGEVIGPFRADKDGVIEVPDDFQEATRALSQAAGVRRYRAPKPPKE